MRTETVQHLLSINREFYQKFGRAFAETRRRVQPGVEQALSQHIHDGDWLDIGCGSGALMQRWARHGLQGSYTGLDFSHALLAEALKAQAPLGTTPGLEVRFVQADMMDENWVNGVGRVSLDGVLAFASLHHLPGAETRLRLLRQVANLLKPGGLFIHSEWQFQHSPKLMSRVQPWSLVGIDEGDLDAGDTLLDWRHALADQDGMIGLRYVHLFNEEELGQLARQSGFSIIEQYASDGTGEKLGLYQVWVKE